MICKWIETNRRALIRCAWLAAIAGLIALATLAVPALLTAKAEPEPAPVVKAVAKAAAKAATQAAEAEARKAVLRCLPFTPAGK